MTYEPESYDMPWTREERCRVEALRIVADGGGQPARDMVSDATILAAFIAGPEGLVPMPWQQIREIRTFLNDVFGRVNVSPYGDDPWGNVPDDAEISFKVSEIRQLHTFLRTLSGEPPF